MNTEAAIPDDIRRFILTSIPSVPYLEAILLLRHDAARAWDGKALAQRLYMSEKAAAQLLVDLCEAAVARAVEVEPGAQDPLPRATVCRYSPGSDDLRRMIDLLAGVYARNLVEVTNLIHSKTSKKAQHFADAFKWRKDS